MIDVNKIVQEQLKNLEDIPEEQRQNVIDMMTAFGNFMNCFWVNNETQNNEQNKHC